MNTFAPERGGLKKKLSTGTMLTGRVSSAFSAGEATELRSVVSHASSSSFGSQQVPLPNGRSLPYVLMMEKMKQVLPTSNLRHKMTVYKNCFLADDAIKAFQAHFPEDIQTNQAAIAFGRTLQRARILTHVVDAEKSFRAGHFFFRLQCYQQPEILNSYRISNKVCEGDPMDILDVIGCLLMGVEDDAKDKHSGLVDYRAASKSPCFSLLEDACCQLQGLDLGAMDEMTRTAVALNIYNIMVKYAFMKVGAPVNRSGRGVFFSGLKINVGGDLLSLDDLEHGILRGNRPPYGSAKSTYFAADDPRARLVPSRVDPRIHFGLRCTPTATSNTTMVYPNTLHYDLQREARRYLSDHSNFLIDPVNHEIHLNQIFQWYGGDFCGGSWPKFARFLLSNLEGGRKEAAEAMLANSEKAPRISYLPFNWGLKYGNFYELKPCDIKANEMRVLPVKNVGSKRDLLQNVR